MDDQRIYLVGQVMHLDDYAMTTKKDRVSKYGNEG